MCLQKPFLDKLVVIHIDQYFNDTGTENYKLSQRRPCAIKYCNAEEDVYLCSNYLFLKVLFHCGLQPTYYKPQTTLCPFFSIYRPMWATLIEILRK